MTEIEKVMNSSYYTIVLINRLGERVARSAFAFDAEAVRQWIKPGEKVLGIFSQSKEKAWTVCD